MALAQALLAPASLLVLDEPYGGLDDDALAAATALVDKAVAGGATVLLAAPEPDEAHLLAILAGLAFGSVLSRPVVDRRAWAVLAGACCCLGEILIPGAPPTRLLLAAFTISPGGSRGMAGPLEAAAAGTLGLCTALVSAGYLLARRRA